LSPLDEIILATQHDRVRFQAKEVIVGIAALVLGILAILMAVIPSFAVTQGIGAVLAVLSLVFGVLGRSQASREGQPTGLSTAGMVLGIVAFVLNVIIFAACQFCVYKVGEGIEQGLKEAQKQIKIEMKKQQQIKIKTQMPEKADEDTAEPIENR
jgi:membrane-bound ClpP family serine protease